MKVFGTTLISGFIHRCNSISSNGMMSSAPAACRGNKKQVLSACRAAQTFVWGGFQRSNPPPLLQIKLAPLYLKGPDIEDALRRPSAKEEQVQELCRHLGAALGCSRCRHPQHPHAMRMHATSACACSHWALVPQTTKTKQEKTHQPNHNLIKRVAMLKTLLAVIQKGEKNNTQEPEKIHRWENCWQPE